MNEIDWEARGVPKENDYVEIIAEGMSQLQCQSQSLECVGETPIHLIVIK